MTLTSFCQDAAVVGAPSNTWPRDPELNELRTGKLLIHDQPLDQTCLLSMLLVAPGVLGTPKREGPT